MMNYKQMVEAFQTINQQLKLLQEQQDILHRRLCLLEPVGRPNTWHDTLGCKVCGLGSDGAMAYVCARPDCPTKVTCVNPQDGF